MKAKITVDATQASKWLYELFMQDTWLLVNKPVRHDNPDIEHQAISFLLAVTEQGVSDWGNNSQAVKETVSFLTSEFTAKLMLPQSPFAKTRWEVSSQASPSQKALEIIAFEIRRSHPQFSALN